MGIFGKEDEYVDYTLLKKKGLLKIKKEEVQKNLKTEGGFIDLTASKTGEAEQSSTNNFGFPADSSSPSPLANFDVINPNMSSSELPANIDGKEFNALKIKVEDLDYKIDRFIERIDKLEEKLARFG